MNYGSLPVTGTGVMIAGNVYGAWWIALVGLIAVVLGAALVRSAFRRGKTHAEI